MCLVLGLNGRAGAEFPHCDRNHPGTITQYGDWTGEGDRIGDQPMSSKQLKTRHPNDLDLKRNPGIGQTTRGLDQQGMTFEDEEAESTIEGDVMNDTEGDGSINPDRRGRTNR